MAGCAKINVSEEGLVVPEGEMAVCLTVAGPFSDATTRSYVSGTEDAISSVEMLCFDGEGKFITERTAIVTPSTSDPATKGSLTGSVPSNTCRIHFVANFNGLDISGYGMGSLERAMMKSDALSSSITDHVRFWGYHTESSASAMKTWLSAGNTVKLLRDRAKVVVTLGDQSGNGEDAISSFQWTIGNGLNKGYVAATCVSGNNPYTNDYVTSTRLTEYSSSGRYATMSDVQAIWAALDAPQFIFENANTQSNPLKVVIKAIYSDNTERYHTVLLQDNNSVPYQVVRNRTYNLTLKKLPKSAGSDNLDDALTTTDYSNNPYAQVDQEVDEVSTDKYTLKVEKTVYLFTEDGNGVVNFTYTGHDGGDISGLSVSSFNVSWLAKDENDDCPDEAVAEATNGDLVAPTVSSFNTLTGAGTITFPLATLSTDIKHSSLQIIAGSGLSRVVEIYSVSKFNFKSNPALVDNYTTRTTGGHEREVYKLTFALPDNFPGSQYPLKVKMYTSTLSPYSDASASSPSGSFNVVVADTDDLVESNQTSSWNYGAKSWGSYYEYVIEEPSSDNSYTIYLNDLLANYGRDITKVGMYFEIDGFEVNNVSKIPLTAQHIVTETRTFQNASFSFSGNTGTSTMGNVTVTLGNSDSYRDQAVYIYTTEYALRIGRDQGDGTVTVAAASGFVITSIEVTYFHRNRQTGGLTGTVYWEAKDFVGGNVSASTGSYSKSGLNGTWTGDPSQSVTLTMSRDSANESPRITQIRVICQTQVD